MRKIAVIGTAGRGRDDPLSGTLWLAMVEDFRGRVRSNDHIFTGGAAWADHLGVHAYLEGWCKELTLHLPAPFQVNRYLTPATRAMCAASAANYYHQNFRKTTGVNGLAEIHEAIMKGANVTMQAAVPGMSGFFRRNALIASSVDSAIAYDWSPGPAPMGGTLDTWRQISSAEKVHINLMELATRPAPSALDAHEDTSSSPSPHAGV